MIVYPELLRPKQEDCLRFEASLGYIVSSGLHSETVSKKKKDIVWFRCELCPKGIKIPKGI